MKKVFTCGGVSFNSVIKLDNFFQPKPQTIHQCNYSETIGNTGAGKALNFARLGFSTTLHTLLGNDKFGKKLKAQLKEAKLNLIYDVDPKGTERHINILNGVGERISIFTNPSSDFPDVNINRLIPYIKGADIVVINISNYCRELLPISKKFKKEIWTDLHDYDGSNPYHDDFINAADYIFFSSENFPEYKKFMEEQINNGKKLVVCTHGKKGSTAITQEKKWIETSAISDYKLLNSNGAGDAFMTGFIYGFHKNCSTDQCLKYATIAGGLTVESEEISNPELKRSNSIELEYNRHFHNNKLNF